MRYQNSASVVGYKTMNLAQNCRIKVKGLLLGTRWQVVFVNRMLACAWFTLFPAPSFDQETEFHILNLELLRTDGRKDSCKAKQLFEITN